MGTGAGTTESSEEGLRVVEAQLRSSWSPEVLSPSLQAPGAWPCLGGPALHILIGKPGSLSQAEPDTLDPTCGLLWRRKLEFPESRTEPTKGLTVHRPQNLPEHHLCLRTHTCPC